MATFNVRAGCLKGSLVIPPSKSHTMRAILFGSLGCGKSRIHNYLKSPDVFAMIRAMQLCGVEITVKEEVLEIVGLEGRLGPPCDVIDAGNSGQVLRFIGSMASLIPSYTVITGDHSIRHQRPVLPLLEGIRQLGGFADSYRLDGKAPILIKGPIRPGHAEFSGEDSQPVSGLLMATSFLDGKSTFHVINPGETPWIELTLSWIRRLGGRVTHQNYEHYEIEGGLSYRGFDSSIPGDFSSAAFPIAAALITKSEITLENLDLDDVQGDKKIIEVLTRMGATFIIDREGKRVTPILEGALNGIEIDAGEMIDALPILGVLALYAKGKTRIFNAKIARSKESDRISAITEELRKMGGVIKEEEDGLIIQGSSLKGAFLESHKDHRIAMALVVAALGADGDSSIEGVECIAKSFPTFQADFQTLGVSL